MTDGKELFHAAQPAQAPATDTRVTAREGVAADATPSSSPDGEGPAVGRSRFRIAQIVGLLIVGAAASWLYIGEVTNNLGPAPPPKPAGGKPEQINQVQRRNEGDRLVREPAAEVAQLRQALEQARDRSEQQVRDLATELAQLKQALQQERGKAEQPDSGLTADVAQLRQALQQQRDEGGQQIRELAAKLVEMKQAQQQERGKPSNRTAGTPPTWLSSSRTTAGATGRGRTANP